MTLIADMTLPYQTRYQLGFQPGQCHKGHIPPIRRKDIKKERIMFFSLVSLKGSSRLGT